MEKTQFKAESKRLLDLMIHSIYTNKEIFLRELISNASDALDKLCYISLTDDSVGLSRGDFSIEITPDMESRTLRVSDNGIGMSREELESNLGTIARSGSLDFKNDMGEENADIDIIGQFGVGFYSAFMVSDQITVISKKYGEDTAHRWESSGADGYTIEECDKESAGTDIIMQIKPSGDDEDYDRFLSSHSLAALVKKYSDYIRYPVRMEMEKRRNKNEGDAEKSPEWETYSEVETLNSMVPLWQRRKADVADEELNAFYKEKFFDYEDPAGHLWVDAEGLLSYKALLFFPAKASYDYYTKDYKKGLQLYSSGVLIMDRCEDLIPEYFRFVRGVVDSPDISLNISREILQQTRQVRAIATNIEKKIRGELARMMQDERERYQKLWDAFGLQLKYGVLADFGMNKEKLQDLLLFHSSAGDDLTSLSEYVERMGEDQKSIYYATGDTIARIAALPQTEYIREKGYEILYFTDEADEFVAQTLMKYQDKPLKSVRDDDPDLKTDEEKKDLEKLEESSKDLLAFVKSVLGNSIKEAKISQKLRNHPVCLTADGSLSFEMEKYLNQVQPDGHVHAERVLELNAGHPVFDTLKSLQATGDEKAATYVKILYAQAELLAGLAIDDVTAYSELVFSLL